jgi:hypothetical protein
MEELIEEVGCIFCIIVGCLTFAMFTEKHMTVERITPL